MVQQLKTTLSVFASLLAVTFAPLSYAAALPMGPVMAGMPHHPAAGGCAMGCPAAVGPRDDERSVAEDEDDEDDLQPAPFFVGFRPSLPPERRQVAAERFVYKVPPKVPHYIQFAQLRP